MNGIARPLLAWQRQHGRHDLPWQRPRSPYRVWVSEIMLQQTQVTTVKPYFEHFVDKLPTLAALAKADEDQVFALWSGLGYYRRARFMHQSARICMEHHAGDLPREYVALLRLPGIGRSTAGAILAQVHGQPFAILDGNVKRVLARYHGVYGWPGESAVAKRLWALAEQHTPDKHVAAYTQAIMDLGATVCIRSRPRCDACPLHDGCVARGAGLTAQLPQRRARKTVPERATCMLILHDPHGRVWLQRRGPQGVWSGLWSLPEATDESAAERLATSMATGVVAVRAGPAFEHKFTHFRLRIQALHARVLSPGPVIADNAGQRWCTRADWLQLGLPAPVRRLLESLPEES